MSTLKLRIQLIVNNKFVRNVALIASGTAGAQVLGMLMMPFITRLYGPEAFGVLGAFTAVVTAVVPVAALTYPVAIVLAEDDKEASQIGGLSILISISFALIVLIFLIGFDQKIIDILKLKEVGHYIFLLPIVMVFSVLSQVAKQWAIRKKLYKRIANTSISQALISNGSMLAIGFFYPISIVLILVYSLNTILQAILLLTSNFFTFFKHAINLPIQQVKLLCKKYYDFPLYRAPQVALNAFAESVPVLFFTAFFGSATAGFYALTRMALGLPAGLIGQSVTEVFYPRFVEADRKRENKQKLLFKAVLILAAIGIIPYTFVIVTGPWLFSLVFGKEWIVAGEFARWMSIWLFATLITRPVIAAIPVLKMQGAFLSFEVFALLFRALSIYSGFYFYKDEVFSIAFLAIANFILYIFLFYLSYLKSGKNINE